MYVLIHATLLRVPYQNAFSFLFLFLSGRDDIEIFSHTYYSVLYIEPSIEKGKILRI